MELINILKAIWQAGGLEWWRIAIICVILALTATGMGKLAKTSYRGAKVSWNIQGLEGWHATMVRILLLMTGAGLTPISKRDYKNPFGMWLDIARVYIWVWIVSMIIFGAYGTIIPLLIFAFSSIGKLWAFRTHQDKNGETEAQKLWAEVKPFLPEKEAPKEKK